jgi:hypothetical protein
MYLLTYMILYRICLHISQSSTAEISCSLYSLVSVTSYLGHRTKPIRRNTIIHTKMGRKERVSDRRVELPRLNIGGERRGTLGMEGVRNHNFVGALTVHTKNQCKRTIIVSNGSSTRVCVHLSPVHQPGDCKKKKENADIAVEFRRQQVVRRSPAVAASYSQCGGTMGADPKNKLVNR